MFLFALFSLPFIFTLLASSLSRFLTASIKLYVVLPTKFVSLFFISPSSSLLLFFSLSFASLSSTFSFQCRFLCLSLSLLYHDSKIVRIVDMTINLSLILKTTQIETIFAFQLSLLFETRLALQFPAEKDLSCIWVAIPLIELSYFGGLPVVQTEERSIGQTVT